MKGVVILGSTGSIGRQTLDVIARRPGRWRVLGLAAGSNAAALAEQARRFRPAAVAVADPRAAAALRAELAQSGIAVTAGPEAVAALAVHPEADLVVSAMVGAAGLVPTYEAVRAGKDVALANKETLVAAGERVTAAARESGARLLPVDSEHSGLFQCLQGQPREGVRRVVLTASGGPFRGWSRERLAREATVEAALRHPTWRMGPTITIDSATLMNKGLEVIEARWLFDLPLERIDVCIHPESVVHALVEMRDGSVLAQLSRADMRLPIQYALGYPERLDAVSEPLDLAALGALHFERPDREAFPCLDLAYAAGRAGGTLPAAMNAAKEVAVAAFLQGRIAFLEIPRIIDKVMASHPNRLAPSLEEVLEADREARLRAEALVAGRREEEAPCRQR